MQRLDTDFKTEMIPADIKETIRGRLLREFSVAPERRTSDLQHRVEELLLDEGCLWPRRMIDTLSRELSDDLFGLGPIEALMRDPSVSEIMLNGPDSAFVERDGRTWIPAPGDPDETDHVIRGIAGGEMSEAAFRDWIAQRIG